MISATLNNLERIACRREKKKLYQLRKRSYKEVNKLVYSIRPRSITPIGVLVKLRCKYTYNKKEDYEWVS